MQDVKYFNSIDEVFLSVRTIDSNISTVLSVDSSSQAAFKLIKKMMVLCNSISITLLQQDYLEETLSLLKISDKADSELSRFGQSGLTWQGRLMTPAILSFLYFKQNRYMDALKFLYKSHTLVQEIKEAGLAVHSHIRNLLNLLTFIVLWKLGKFIESEKYVDAVEPPDLTSIRGRNLYGVVCAAKAAVICKKGKDFLLAAQICEQALGRLEKDDICVDLLKDVGLFVFKEIGELRGTNEKKTAEDWLVNQNFLTVFFVTCFIPLIAPGTPVLKLNGFGKDSRVMNASRVKNLGKVLIEENLEKASEHHSLTARRGKGRTSKEKIQNLSFNLPYSNLNKAYLNATGKLNFLSPRIGNVKRPTSSRVTVKRKLMYGVERK
jgi:hypothetical protein